MCIVKCIFSDQIIFMVHIPFKLRAGIKTDFICVYISGANAEKVTKESLRPVVGLAMSIRKLL